MALWHLFFIYRKSENNALESLVFHCEYASKSYQDPNTGNLMNKQGSFWMILSGALAASPEVVFEVVLSSILCSQNSLASLPKLVHL